MEEVLQVPHGYRRVLRLLELQGMVVNVNYCHRLEPQDAHQVDVSPHFQGLDRNEQHVRGPGCRALQHCFPLLTEGTCRYFGRFV